jgi:hypothetical protein
MDGRRWQRHSSERPSVQFVGCARMSDHDAKQRAYAAKRATVTRA